MNLIYICILASTLTVLDAAIVQRHDSRRWSRPLIVADEEEVDEPSTDLRAPSKDSVDYYQLPKQQEPRVLNAQNPPEDSDVRVQSPEPNRPIQFTLSTRLNVSSEDSRKPQVFPVPKYGGLPKKFLGLKNKPHYLKFYAGDAMAKSKNAQLKKNVYDSKSEALVPRLSFVRPTVEVSSSEEDEEDTQQNHADAQRTKTKVEPKSTAQTAKSFPVGLTDGKERVEFQMHGHDGPQSYKFGYDTGKGSSRQFRFEERDNDGSVRGHYGFFDGDGKMHVIKYRASADDGFRTDE